MKKNQATTSPLPPSVELTVKPTYKLSLLTAGLDVKSPPECGLCVYNSTNLGKMRSS